MENKQELSIGEKRVRTSFNPEAQGVVDVIKSDTAKLINLIDQCPNQDVEVRRLVSLAMTAYEEAAMWAVKAVTSKS